MARISRHVILVRPTAKYQPDDRERAIVLRHTAQYLVVKVLSTGAVGYVDRATGTGAARAPGRPSDRREEVADMTGWRLRWADFSRWWVDGPRRESLLGDSGRFGEE